MKRVKCLARPALGAALAMGAGAAAGYSSVVSYSGEVFVNLVTSGSNASATASVTYNDTCVSRYHSFNGANMSVTQALGPTQIAMASTTTTGNNFQFGPSAASLNVTCAISSTNSSGVTSNTSNTFNIPLVFGTVACDGFDGCGVKTGDLLQVVGIGPTGTPPASYGLPSSYTNCPTWGTTTQAATTSQTIAAVNTQQESLNFFVPTSSVTSGLSNSQIPAVAVDIQLFYAGFNLPNNSADTDIKSITPLAPFLIQVACGPLSSFGQP